MTTVVRRFPTFEIDLITQKTSYALTYDTASQAKQFTSGNLEESLIQFYITNDMTQDSPVFSLIILAKTKWDEVLNANDLIRVRVYPDRTQKAPDNPYIMVGLISDIHKEGEYVNGTLLYRITGNAMTKALMDFDVGVIQEISTVLVSSGWLPDVTTGGHNPLQFSGNNASGIAGQLMSRFVMQYIQYAFSNGKTLQDYFTYALNSWTNDEYLQDVTPYINYQGSMLQFLTDVSAQPFNELFFEYTKDGKCVMIMRPTPFDPDAWTNVPAYEFTSDIVVEESYGKSDSEMYSIFVVSTPNLSEITPSQIGVFPKYNPELVKKYGYKEYSVENQYLLTPGSANSVSSSSSSSSSKSSTSSSKSSTSSSSSGTAHTASVATSPTSTAPTSNTNPNTPTTGAYQVPTYTQVYNYLNSMGYLDVETIRTKRNTVYTNLHAAFQGLNQAACNAILDDIVSGVFNSSDYQWIVQTSATQVTDNNANKEKTVAIDKLDEFTQRLFNWYCENSNFYSGDIRVLGNPAFRVGTRIIYRDAEEGTTWEFYVESVEHDFDFTQGYTTILGVTRGLPDSGAKRFNNLWGTSQDFKGGLMGEASMVDLIQTPTTASTTSGTQKSFKGTVPPGTPGGPTAMSALQYAVGATSLNTVYREGGGRTGVDPLTQNPAIMDCSSFVWWCYKQAGAYLKGGSTGMTTKTIASDPQLQIISNRGNSKDSAIKLMKQGDIIFFDTAGADGHVGIYAGDGQFVACNGPASPSGVQQNDMTSGYWYKNFRGHVLRYNDANNNNTNSSTS